MHALIIKSLAGTLTALTLVSGGALGVTALNAPKTQAAGPIAGMHGAMPRTEAMSQGPASGMLVARRSTVAPAMHRMARGGRHSVLASSRLGW